MGHVHQRLVNQNFAVAKPLTKNPNPNLDPLITTGTSCTSSVPGVNQAVLASANPGVSASPVAVVSAQDNGELASITWNLDPASWEKQWQPEEILDLMGPARSKMQMWRTMAAVFPVKGICFFVWDVNYLMPVSSSRSQ